MPANDFSHILDSLFHIQYVKRTPLNRNTHAEISDSDIINSLNHIKIARIPKPILPIINSVR